jgi:hypothetical protein
LQRAARNAWPRANGINARLNRLQPPFDIGTTVAFARKTRSWRSGSAGSVKWHALRELAVSNQSTVPTESTVQTESTVLGEPFSPRCTFGLENLPRYLGVHYMKGHRMSLQRPLSALALACFLSIPTMALADSNTTPSIMSLEANPTVATDQSASDQNASTDAASGAAPADFASSLALSGPPANGAASKTNTDLQPVMADDSGKEAPNIHGFAGTEILTDYITPRGLVVADTGIVTQPIVGLVFPIGDVGPFQHLAIIGGIWNCLTSKQESPSVGCWNELDDFFSASADIMKGLNLTATYVAFNSPTGAYTTEHNVDLLISYDDSSLWGSSGFGLHPNIDCWYAISGSSTVVAGRKGGTGYFQPGIAPSYTFNANPNYPVTLSVPAYISLGPPDYWSVGSSPRKGTWGNGNVGVFSVAVEASMPLSFIPGRYGNWFLDGSVHYFDIISNGLLFGGELASGNTRRDLIMGELGVTVKF